MLNAFPEDFIRTSGVIGLLEASGVARWIFSCFEVYVYGPPPVLTKTNLREFFGVFLSSLCSPNVFKSVLQLSHHFSTMVRQLDSTLLSLTEILRVPKGYLGCFDSRSHHDCHYVSERWDRLIG